jgi:hypothetical protein
MRDSKFLTVFPDLLGERFQLRQFSSMSNYSSPAAPEDRSLIKQRIKSIIDSIVGVKDTIGSTKWCGAGFGALEKLARTIDSALCLEDEIERYHQLSWLRSWMFWVDLRQTNEGKEEHTLTGHFYALLLAVVPIFPARYQESLAEACRRKMRVARLAISDDTTCVEGEI